MCKEGQHESVFEPTVSVVVPVLNGEATIQRLLESLLEIDYPKAKIEIAIVDGISTDQTRNIVAKYPVKLLVEGGKGANAARNTGIEHASGEIIAFTDSDCVVSEDWIKKAVGNFRDPRIGCVGGNVKGFNDDFLSRYACDSIFPVIRVCKKRKELDSIGPLAGCPVGCNVSFRREALVDVGGFDESIQCSFEEDELIERLCRSGYRLLLDPTVLVWHKHRSSLKGILKQSHKYGKGAGRLLKRPMNQKIVRRWFFVSMCGLAQAILIIGLISFMILAEAWQILMLFLLTMILAPMFGLMMLYASRRGQSRKYLNIFAYPFLDLLRMFAFLFGQARGFIGKTD